MASTGKDMTIYWGSGSIPSWRVLIALEEKQLSDAKKSLLSFEKKEHKSDVIMDLNPRGQVPTFTDGDAMVHESIGTCFYVELVYKNQGRPLLPEDPVLLAEVLQRVHESNTILVRTSHLVRAYSRMKDTMTTFEDKEGLIQKDLDLWESYLTEEAKYMVGTQFSMADVIFFPIVAMGVRVGLTLNRWPRLKHYYNALKERPSIQKTWPPHWHTSEPKTWLSQL